MALPQLIDYATPERLPDSRAPWTLQPQRAAVLVHDLQRYFVRPYAEGCPALATALAATRRILEAARAAGVPVFYTAQDGDHSDRGLQRDLWGPGMSAEPEHTAILDGIEPAPGETVIPKRRYSAFAKSDLAQRLGELGRDQLVIVGVYAHIGITATAYDAFCGDVKPFVVADGVADFGLEQHERALEQVAACCGVVATANAVVDALSDGPDEESGWAERLRAALAEVSPDEVVAAAWADHGTDLFELGLNSLAAFEMLDILAEETGVDIDFGEFTRDATLRFLLEQGSRQALANA